MMDKKHNLSEVPLITFDGIDQVKVAIVTADWNPEVTLAMRDAANDYLLQCGVAKNHIITEAVPGSYELPLGAQIMLERGDIDGVVCIGCIIQGETRHFDFIADAVAQGIMQVNLEYHAPVSFGVLTTNNNDQALARAGGIHGNKGIEAASAVVSMLRLQRINSPL
jgi:6,7-dimethyl-8-ribityllumazine synthase